MRIIAGIYRGRSVKFPNSKLVRPTTDKVKESLFNYLTNLIHFDDMKVCDIYAGSGSLGLESLSRGAGEVHFVEKNYPVYKVLVQNVKSIDEHNRTKVLKMDALRFSKLEEHDKYDLILADPPFFKDDIHKVAENILERGYLNDNGTMIIERSVQTEKEDIRAFGMEPFKKLGDSLIYQFDN